MTTDRLTATITREAVATATLECTTEVLAEASRYRLEIQRSSEDQFLLLSLPELDGIRTHASTITEAAERGAELAAEYLYGMRSLDFPVPAPQSPTPTS